MNTISGAPDFSSPKGPSYYAKLEGRCNLATLAFDFRLIELRIFLMILHRSFTIQLDVAHLGDLAALAKALKLFKHHARDAAENLRRDGLIDYDEAQGRWWILPDWRPWKMLRLISMEELERWFAKWEQLWFPEQASLPDALAEVSRESAAAYRKSKLTEKVSLVHTAQLTEKVRGGNPELTEKVSSLLTEKVSPVSANIDRAGEAGRKVLFNVASAPEHASSASVAGESGQPSSQGFVAAGFDVKEHLRSFREALSRNEEFSDPSERAEEPGTVSSLTRAPALASLALNLKAQLAKACTRGPSVPREPPAAVRERLEKLLIESGEWSRFHPQWIELVERDPDYVAGLIRRCLTSGISIDPKKRGAWMARIARDEGKMRPVLRRQMV